MQTAHSNLDQTSDAASEKKGNSGVLRVFGARETACEESR